MADNEERIKIQFDTNADQAKVSVDGLNTSLGKTNDAASNLGATFDEVYGDLKPLTARMGEAEDRLYELALAGETATTEYKQLLEVVANYRKTQIQTDQVVDAAATTLGQKLGGAAQIAATGVQGVTAGMALFGGQSEETEKALLKVQAAMAFADAISNISTLGGQFRVFKGIVVDAYAAIIAKKQAEVVVTNEAEVAQNRLNLAVLKNPYVIAAAAIAALTVGIYAWVKANGESAKQEQKVTDSVNKNKLATDALAQSIEESKNAASASNDIEVLRARAYGATDKQIQQLIKSQKELAITTAFTQNKEAYNNLLKANKDYWAAVKTGNEELINNAKETQQRAQEIYKQSNEDYGNAINENVKFTLQSRIEEQEQARQAQEKAEEAARKRREELAAKEKERRLKEKEEREADAAALLDFQKTIVEAEHENDLQDKDNKLQALKDFNSEVEAETTRTSEEINNINQKKAEQEKAIQDATTSLGNQGIAVAKDIFAKNKAIQKGIIVAEGAVALGKVATNTVEAVSKDNAASPLTFGMPWSGIHIGQGVLNAASIVSSTTKALKALGGGGSISNAGSSVPTVTGASAAPQTGFQASNENQIATSIASRQTEAPIVKAYVVSQDMTDQQKKDANLISQNSFGGK